MTLAHRNCSSFCHVFFPFLLCIFKLRVSRKTFETDSITSPRSKQRHLVGKRTEQKDAIQDITSDSQMNSYFSYRWPPASLEINMYFIYFHLFLYLYIKKITINYGTSQLKSLKHQNKSRLGTASNKITGGGASTSLRSSNPCP